MCTENSQQGRLYRHLLVILSISIYTSQLTKFHKLLSMGTEGKEFMASAFNNFLPYRKCIELLIQFNGSRDHELSSIESICLTTIVQMPA